MRLPSVVSLKSYVKPTRFPAFTRFNVCSCATASPANIAASARI